MNDLDYIELAAQFAKKADKALTFENPRVGALIVKNDVILSTGYHEKFGNDHAEINAFNNLANKSDVVDATLYVTLEPCAVDGKVSSCAREIRNWHLNRVVIGDLDPNPDTHGLGVEILRDAGINVTVLNTQHSFEINSEFYFYFEKRLPYVQLKLATSRNGFVSNSSDHRLKLTDYIADQDVHHERAKRSAIVIGSQTFLKDRPLLNVRYNTISHNQPLRIVIDRRARLKKFANQVDTNWLIYTEDIDFYKSFDYVLLINDGLMGVLKDLESRHIQSVLVEGGPTLLQSFLDEDLWNEMIIYQTDHFILDGKLEVVLPKIEPIEKNHVGNSNKIIYVNSTKESL